jgi:hypothetical protein
MNDLAAVRAWYAQELRYAAAVKSRAIAQAFATFPAKRIDAAVRRGDMGAVKSLRREAHEEDATCWLHADGWCQSRQAV